MKEFQMLFYSSDYAFTGDRIDMISLAVYDYFYYKGRFSGNAFYAECIDFDRTLCTDVLSQDAVKNLALNDMRANTMKEEWEDVRIRYYRGNKFYVKSKFDEWIDMCYRDCREIEMVTSTSHHDLKTFNTKLERVFLYSTYKNYHVKDKELSKSIVVAKRIEDRYNREQLFKLICEFNKEEELLPRDIPKGTSLYDAFRIAYIFKLKEYLLSLGVDDEVEVA